MKTLFFLIAYTMIFLKMYIVFILCTKFPHRLASKPVSWRHLVKCKMAAIQDLGQGGNIAFPISYTISFPKMYSFHTLCYLQAEILTKPVSWWSFVNKC